jgi:hypothetical protein
MNACETDGSDWGTWISKQCSARALCITHNGENTGHCSCEYSSDLLSNRSDNTCGIVPLTYLVFAYQVLFVILDLSIALRTGQAYWNAWKQGQTRWSSVDISTNFVLLSALFKALGQLVAAFRVIEPNDDVYVQYDVPFTIFYCLFGAFALAAVSTFGLSLYTAMRRALRMEFSKSSGTNRRPVIAIVIQVLFLLIGLTFLLAYKQIAIAVLFVLVVTLGCWLLLKIVAQNLQRHEVSSITSSTFETLSFVATAVNSFTILLIVLMAANICLVILWYVGRAKHSKPALSYLTFISIVMLDGAAIALLARMSAVLTKLIKFRTLNSLPAHQIVEMKATHNSKSASASVSKSKSGSHQLVETALTTTTEPMDNVELGIHKTGSDMSNHTAADSQHPQELEPVVEIQQPIHTQLSWS